MGRPRTRSLTKAVVDHNEDIEDIEQTGDIEIPLIQPKPNVQTRQNKLNVQPFRQSSQQPGQSGSGQSKQSRVKRSASIGRPGKFQPKNRLSSSNILKRKKSGKPKQKSQLLQNITDDYDDDDDTDDDDDD